MAENNAEQPEIPKVFNIGNKMHEKLKKQRQEKLQKVRRTLQERLSSKLRFFHSGRLDVLTEKEKTPRDLVPMERSRSKREKTKTPRHV